MLRKVYFDKLTLKLAFGVTLMVVTVMGVALYSSSKLHYNRQIEAYRQSTDVQMQLVSAAIEHQMVAKDRTLINKIVNEISAQDKIQNMFILDHDGRVSFSSDPDMVGKVFSKDSPSCMVCHQYPPDRRDRSALIEMEGGNVLRGVHPIRNRPACYSCHSSENKINGVLFLDTSLNSLKDQLNADYRWMVLGATLLSLFLLTGIGFAVRQLILKRLATLANATRIIAGGNLQHRVKIEGNDKITRLGMEFNHMAISVSELVAKVKSEQARVEKIINSVNDELIVFDRGFNILAVNDAFLLRTGQKREEVIGRSCQEVSLNEACRIPDQDHCLGTKCFSNQAPQQGTFTAPSSEGERAWEVHTSPIYDEGGSVIQVVEVWRDITDRMREEIRLAEVERLTSLGMLASGISHEINTPLNSMLLCIDGILQRLTGSGGGQPKDDHDVLLEYADIIRSEILRCTSITQQFLRFSKGDKMSVELIDLKEVIHAVVPLVAPTAREKGVRVQAEIHGAIPLVNGNYALIQQVLINLIINAVQACQDGGEVRVHCIANSEVRVTVQDTGVGIPKDELGRIFDPFFTKRPNGTGLGLFLSLNIIRRFGGAIRVESEECVGSQFVVALPVSEEG